MEIFPVNKIFEVVEALVRVHREEFLYEVTVLDSDRKKPLTFYHPRFLDAYWRELFFENCASVKAKFTGNIVNGKPVFMFLAEIEYATYYDLEIFFK